MGALSRWHGDVWLLRGGGRLGTRSLVTCVTTGICDTILARLHDVSSSEVSGGLFHRRPSVRCGPVAHAAGSCLVLSLRRLLPAHVPWETLKELPGYPRVLRPGSRRAISRWAAVAYGRISDQASLYPLASVGLQLRLPRLSSRSGLPYLLLLLSTNVERSLMMPESVNHCQIIDYG
jgi:hypothetical protein